MKHFKKSVKIISTIIIIISFVLLFFPTWTQHIKGENSISVLKQVEINGTGHEIMIRGNDKDNPVILFVHGGPGSSEIPYAAKYQNLLENRFTVVNYDQRGTGKSYHFFEDYSNLSSDLLINDLIAITDYITKSLRKDKVILIGHSYGTYIAIQAAHRAPEKYEAYVGIGQMGDIVESEIDSFNYVINQARQAGNTDDVQQLQKVAEAIQNGAAFTPRNYVEKYGGASRLIDNPDSNMMGVILSSEYNLLDIIRYNYGLAYSQNMLLDEVFQNPLPTLVTKLDVPFFFIMGKYDFMTSSDAAKKYFDRIEADQKEFITYEKSAHYPQFEEKERFYEWISKTF